MSVERWIEHRRSLAERLPGADLPWLRRLRERALERFAAAGLPTTAWEDWKYTSLGALEKQDFLPAPQAALAPGVAVDPWTLGESAHRLVFVDGRYAPALSRLLELPHRAVVRSLGGVLADDPAQAEPWLAEEEGAGPFADLNTAFLGDGAFIHLGRGVIVGEPVHLLFLSTGTGVAAQPRNLIVAEDDAMVTVVEHYGALAEGASLCNAATRIFAGRDSRVEHYKLQQEGAGAFHLASIRAVQGRGSDFTSHSLSLGAQLARNEIATRFEGEHCETTFNGLYLADGRQHVDHHTRIDHASPHGTSREFYRGILDGRARGVFSGRIVVHKDAQKTDAAQANHNLLLSREAEVDTRPQLEIYADDVKCSHGATVGQLDENQLFYLRTRGIAEELARNLLTYAFAREVIDRIRLRSLRHRLETLLVSRMPSGEELKELT